MEHLAQFENAQSVTLISQRKVELDDSFEERLAKNNVALTLFDSANISGVSLTQSREFCPNLIMSFGSLKNAVEFLDTYKGYLRLKTFSLIYPQNQLQYLQEKKYKVHLLD